MTKRYGFTMIEFVLVIALLGILSTVLGPPLAEGLRGYAIVRDRRSLLAEGRAAMDRMVKEIRLIPSSTNILDVSSSTSFSFQYPAGTTLTYVLAGTDLRRNSNTLATGVTSLTFSYFNAAGTPTSTTSAVRRVRIVFTMAPSGGSGTLTLRTDIFIRDTGTRYAGFDIQ